MNRFDRSFRNAMLVACIVGAGVCGTLGIATIVYPKVATVFYHLDYQYRAGNAPVEENTITEAMYHILDIFDRHPAWNLTIEVESYIIPLMYHNYTSVYDLVKRMVDRGQLEICLIEYSEMLAHAFPYSDFNHSAWYTDEICAQYNITKAKSVLLQEGQWMPAFYRMKPHGYTNFMADAAKFLYFGFEPTAPVYAWDLNSYPGLNPGPASPGTSPDPIYIVNYKHLPVVEAGAYHTWLWTQDAEIQLSAENNSEELGTEFTVDASKKAAYEARLESMAAQGFQFMTVADWVTFCINHGAVQPLDFYMPECHWYPTDYRQCWRWMGDNQGHTDDGAMLALHYRTRNKLQAIECLLLNSTGYLNSTEWQYCRVHLDQAWQNNLLAQATDVLGLQPRNTEREYGFNHSKQAIAELNLALGVLKARNTDFNAHERVQVDVETGQVITANFQNITVLESGLDLADLPVNVTITQTGAVHPYNSSVRRCEYRGVQYWELDVGFEGNLTWEQGVGRYYIDIPWNASSIDYSPSMLEHSTVHLNYAEYNSGNDLFLPLANGLIYADGRALVKNCSRHHVAVHWRSSSLGFEESQLHFYSNYQLFILDTTTSLDDALAFANRVNTSPIVWLSEVATWP
nr:hypothetical protein [Candidatus Sigynarchaeota archaeon]